MLARSKAAWTNASEVESKSEVASQRDANQKTGGYGGYGCTQRTVICDQQILFICFFLHFTSFRSRKNTTAGTAIQCFFWQLAPHPTVRSGDFSPWHGRWRSVGVAHHSVVLPSIPHGQTIACGKGSFKAMTPAIPQRQSETPTLWRFTTAYQDFDGSSLGSCK